jgi:hypothetical protein
LYPGYRAIPFFHRSDKGYDSDKDPVLPFRTVYQEDGNLVVYDSRNVPVWASNTNGKPSTRLTLENDGNLVIFNGKAKVWACRTVFDHVGRWFSSAFQSLSGEMDRQALRAEVWQLFENGSDPLLDAADILVDHVAHDENNYHDEKKDDTNLVFKCYGCGREISFSSFELGYDIPESAGGDAVLSNLRPICSSCYKAMGVSSMKDFMIRCGFDRTNAKCFASMTIINWKDPKDYKMEMLKWCLRDFLTNLENKTVNDAILEKVWQVFYSI